MVMPDMKSAKELMGMYSKLMMVNSNPLISKKKKIERVLEETCKLSENPFNVLASNILKETVIGGDRSYANSDLEIEAFLVKYPRFKPYRNVIKEIVINGRQKVGLVI